VIVCGIDPGLTGAFALYDSERKAVVNMLDVPTEKVTISGSKRTRLLEDELWIGALNFLRDADCRLGIIEGVQGYKDQSASAAFQFGYVVGSVKMAVRPYLNRLETAGSAVWKVQFQVPTDDKGILACAQHHFPSTPDSVWTGPRGGVKHDRCEAALLAKYGAERIFR
jgi:hypothetical protein